MCVNSMLWDDSDGIIKNKINMCKYYVLGTLPVLRIYDKQCGARYTMATGDGVHVCKY